MSLILFEIGAMVGTGIFIGNSCSYISRSSPCCIYHYLSYLCFLICFLCRVCIPCSTTGGAYSYLYAILGEFPAWIAGWLCIMEFVAVSGVASGWAAYFKGLLSHYGIHSASSSKWDLQPSTR